MPLYAYEKPDGEIVQELFAIADRPEEIKVDGVTAKFTVETPDFRQSPNPWSKHKSTALMVHPLDVNTHRKEMADRGLNGTVNNDGTFHFDNAIDHRRYVKAYDFVDYGACR
jgi:hypothetical protein